MYYEVDTVSVIIGDLIKKFFNLLETNHDYSLMKFMQNTEISWYNSFNTIQDNLI